MTTITSLPDELIVIILRYSDITIKDVINFKCVCKKFWLAAKYQQFKEKFSQRWPIAKKVWDQQSKENEEKESKENEMKTKENLNFVKTGINHARKLQSCISNIYHEHNSGNRTIDNLIRYMDIIDRNTPVKKMLNLITYPENIKYYFFIDEITYLLARSSRTIGYDLTKRYCITQILYYIRQERARKGTYCRNQILLEWQATMAAQYLQSEKDVFYSCIKESLDSIAAQVLRYKSGQHIILLIIYQSLARRLGLRCDVVIRNGDVRFNFQTQSCYCMFWKPTYAVNNLQNATCFKIGFNKRFPDCLVDQTSLFIRTYRSFTVVKNSMFTALVRGTSSDLYSCATITALVNKWSIPGIHKYFSLQFECKESNQSNTRPVDVKFTIGMIVTHDDECTNSCIGVIVGWYRQYGIIRCKRYAIHGIQTEICDTASRLYELPLKHNRNIKFEKQQTNYIILTENNTMCHVEEDVIVLTTPRWINNTEIGRYFCKFEGTHYVPNQMLEEFYPQDAAVTAAKVQL